MGTYILLIGVALLVTVLILLTVFTRREKEAPKKTMSADILADELGRHKRENARLNSELKRLISMNNLFFASMIRLTARMNPEEIANATVDLLANQLETDELAVFLYDNAKKHLSLGAQRGFDQKSMEKVLYKLGEGKVGFAAERRYPVGKWEFEPEVYEVKAEPYEIFCPDICYPLLCQDELFGVIAICRDGNFDEREKNLLGVVSTMAAAALNNTRTYERKSHEASLDPLTKLSNIQHFKELLQEQLNRARRDRLKEEKEEFKRHPDGRSRGGQDRDKKYSIAITILDLDRFKDYNDSLGHQAGDELLIRLAKDFRDHFDEKDEIARYGGDEFIIMSPGIGKEDKARMVGNLLRDLEMYDYGYGQPRRKVTCSAGVAGFPEDGGTVRDLIKAADDALYEAKNAGRNTVRVHYPKVKKI
ncbi:sensor domain-containing diguanylate cyclase [candidate division WOR-3 bacterium]|nr:sensor domain-containing diguanylate cyclase [candidate division WOR-3 bacterium]